MATFCSKPGHTEQNNSRLSEEFQETRAMKLPGNFGLMRANTNYYHARFWGDMNL